MNTQSIYTGSLVQAVLKSFQDLCRIDHIRSAFAPGIPENKFSIFQASLHCVYIQEKRKMGTVTMPLGRLLSVLMVGFIALASANDKRGKELILKNCHCTCFDEDIPHPDVCNGIRH